MQIQEVAMNTITPVAASGDATGRSSRPVPTEAERAAATTMLHVETTIASLRGRVHRYKGVPLIVTYHPAYLLRNLPDKAKAWEDLCLARATLRGILQADILQTAGRGPT